MNPRMGLAIGLFACALALRPMAVALGPVLPDIQHDLAIGPVISGVLGMIPVLSLGLFAPVGAQLAARFGPRRALGIALAVTVLFGAARSAAPEVVTLLGTTAGLGIGMGLAGSIPAMIIKARTPGQPALMTGMFGTGVVGGAALAALLIIPFSDLAGGWRGGMLLLSVPIFVSVVFGYRLLGPDPVRPRIPGRAPIPWRDPIAWLIAAIFGLQSLIYWGLAIWLADVLIAMGWMPAAAGTMVALFQVSSLVGVIAAGFAADQLGTRRQQLQACSAAITVGLLGLAVAPSLAALWAVLEGLALGGAFPIAMTLPVDFARDERDAGAKASLMLLVGYLVAAAGPPVVGLVRAATSAAAPVWLLLATFGIAFFILASRVRAGPPH